MYRTGFRRDLKSKHLLLLSSFVEHLDIRRIFVILIQYAYGLKMIKMSCHDIQEWSFIRKQNLMIIQQKKYNNNNNNLLG